MDRGAWDRTAAVCYVTAAVQATKESGRSLSPDGFNPYRKPPKRSLADWFGAMRQGLAEKRAREAAAQQNGDGHGG